MTQPATAFAPGSPSGGPSAAGDLIKGALKGGLGSLIGGSIGGGLSLPGFSSSSSANSGPAMQGGSSTGDGFNVNFGNGVSQGGAAIPGWVWIAAAVGTGVYLWKKRSS